MSLTAGTIQSVSQTPLGSTLAAAATAGDTSIFVTDTSDFDSIAGGELQVGGVQYDYDTVDDDTGEITLLSTLAANADADDRVDAWDAVLGQVAVETRALVALPGTVANDDSIDAIVSQSLAPLLSLGLRDPGAGESVSMQQQGTDWLITDVRGRKPSIQPTVVNVIADRLSATITIDPSSLTGSSYSIPAWDTVNADPVGDALQVNPADPQVYISQPGVYVVTTFLAVDGLQSAPDTCAITVHTVGIGPFGFTPGVVTARGGDPVGGSSPAPAATGSIVAWVDGNPGDGFVCSLQYVGLDPAVTEVDVSVNVVRVS